LHTAQLMPLPLTVSCFSKIQIGFTFLVPAHPGSPGQRAIKRVCVCVRVRACVRARVCVWTTTCCFAADTKNAICCLQPAMLVFPAADVIYAVNVVYCIKLFAQEPAEAIPICSLCLRAETVSQLRGTDDDAMLCCIDCGRCGQSFQHMHFTAV